MLQAGCAPPRRDVLAAHPPGNSVHVFGYSDGMWDLILTVTAYFGPDTRELCLAEVRPSDPVTAGKHVAGAGRQLCSGSTECHAHDCWSLICGAGAFHSLLLGSVRVVPLLCHPFWNLGASQIHATLGEEAKGPRARISTLTELWHASATVRHSSPASRHFLAGCALVSSVAPCRLVLSRV